MNPYVLTHNDGQHRTHVLYSREPGTGYYLARCGLYLCKDHWNTYPAAGEWQAEPHLCGKCRRRQIATEWPADAAKAAE